MNIIDDDNDPSDPLNFDKVDDLVSSILVSEALHTAVIFTERRSYRNFGSEITLSFRLTCATDYFGDDCSTFCRPQNGSRGHFSCDMSGNMTCLPGYSNPAVNCTVPICAHDCGSTGVCVGPGECRCDEGWVGEDCSIQCEPQQPLCEPAVNVCVCVCVCVCVWRGYFPCSSYG